MIRTSLRSLSVLALLAACCSVYAQTSAPDTDPPIVAVHYQDIADGQPTTIDLLIPPPLIEWSQFHYSTASCLRGTGVLEGPPDKALIVQFELEDGESCVTRVDLLFSNATTTWQASAIVIATRLPPAPATDGLKRTMTTGQIQMPYTRPFSPGSDLLLLGLTNTTDQPVRVLGLGNDRAFGTFIGQVFRYSPDTHPPRYEDLLRYGSPFEPTDVAPGASAHFALIVDAHGRLPTGAGTVTIEPVALVEVDGQIHTLSFLRVSSAWGTELP